MFKLATVAIAKHAINYYDGPFYIPATKPEQIPENSRVYPICLLRAKKMCQEIVGEFMMHPK
ncbi:MAG: hypothetical protein QXM68_03855 [Candidatus Aenigmatarchaeota archaeon]|nr:hypothetical protein [Candidatus Aenigmarchaeota archaeon]